MMTNQTQRNELIMVGVVLFLILLTLTLMFLMDRQISTQMTEYCHNQSMGFSHRDTSSFYCFTSTNGTIHIEEVKYR